MASNLRLFEAVPGAPFCCCMASSHSIRRRGSAGCWAVMREIIAPSHPGFGRSPRPKDFESVYDLVNLCSAVLDALPHEKITVLGFSFGGWLAAEMAVRSCHKIDRLILVDPVGIKVSDRETPGYLGRLQHSPGRSEAAHLARSGQRAGL